MSIQNRYNVDDRDSESLVDLCEQEQMVFLPWAPIQDLDGNPARAGGRRARTAPRARQVVLAWLLARSPSILPIPGTGSVAHLEDNVAADQLRLDPEEVATLTAGLS